MNNMIAVNSLNLEDSGLTSWKEVYHNLSYDELYEHEMDPSLEGCERAVMTEFGAVNVDTGRFTGRTPKDKYIVKEPTSQENVWWKTADTKGSDNKPIDMETWRHLKQNSLNQLNGKNLYVMDGFCGANPDTRLNIRVITEVAWCAHFTKNMFIRPTEEELRDFEPDWTILHGCKTINKQWKEMGLNSEVYAAFNIGEKMVALGGSWYGGEIKKGIFSMMNFMLPLRGIGSFHCSANMGEKGDTAMFFGLSGTGKTTLSTDPKRKLIGDDEHGWDDDGIFNYEGGCYAKTINLTRDTEPEIYDAVKRDALLENVMVDENGKVDYTSGVKTLNTRVSYPMYFIKNIVEPVSKGTHPKNILFLTCDAFGILPPVSILNREQAMYQYMSGYTAKVAGTELGITEPVAAFSSCFGAPFLTLHPTRYADILGEKMTQHNSRAYLVNTGWSGGGYNEGQRMPIKATRKILDAIFDGSLEDADTELLPIFNLKIPTSVNGVDSNLLNPRNTWRNKEEYDKAARNLAQMFIDNFKFFTDIQKGKDLEKAGPVL